MGKKKKSKKIKGIEIWSFNYSLAKWSLPRLKEFRKHHIGYPGYLTTDTWDWILDSIIESFELIVRDKGSWMWTPEEELKVYRGFDDFKTWFFDLWD